MDRLCVYTLAADGSILLDDRGLATCLQCGRAVELPPGTRLAARRCRAPGEAPAVPSPAEIAARIRRNREVIWRAVERLLPQHPHHRPIEDMRDILSRWELRCCELEAGELDLYARAILRPHVWRKEWGERPGIS
jgi:hypothetical protein